MRLGFIGLIGAKIDILGTILPTLVIVIGFTDSVHMMIDVRLSRAAGAKPLTSAVETIRHLGLIDYEQCWRSMSDFTDLRSENTVDEIWILQHAPVFTLGQAGKSEHVLAAGDIPVIKVDRGGQVTYHGPGQLVMYLLVDLRRLGIGVRQLVDVIEQSIILTQPKWRDQAHADGITIIIDTDLSEVPPILGINPSDLREVLVNLILNAADAMPDGGTVTIRTQRKEKWVSLEVEDTGIGMTEEIRQRCLEPFFTTKGERGSGLGLSMVYGIVQRLQGTIDIESELGKGTKFTLHLSFATRSALDV